MNALMSPQLRECGAEIVKVFGCDYEDSNGSVTPCH